MQNHVFLITNLNPPTTDKCILSCIGDTVSAKTADIVSATDYSPFGAPLAGRTFSSNGYRFGFNGKEKDDEMNGDGNVYDYGFRIYNPRLGRFLSVDPLTKGFPMLTPYQYASNNPILNIDLDGLEGVNNNIIRNSPVNGNPTISSHYSDITRPASTSNPHGGIDYAVVPGTQVFATANGTVVRADWSNSYGNIVIIDHGPSPSNDGSRTYSLYAHNRSLNVAVGQQVNSGTLIASSGVTGSGSRGDHLHYGVISTTYNVFQTGFYAPNQTRDPEKLANLLPIQIANSGNSPERDYLEMAQQTLAIAKAYGQLETDARASLDQEKSMFGIFSSPQTISTLKNVVSYYNNKKQESIQQAYSLYEIAKNIKLNKENNGSTQTNR
jgi:RHS repeat-associated protein